MMSKILLIGNSEIVIYNFRLELVQRLLEEGNKVVVSFPNISGDIGQKKIDALVNMGCVYEPVMINRHGTDLNEEFKLYKAYYNLIKKQEPDIVFSYTIKPNIYGAIAARKLSVPFVANITGLGIAIENPGIMQRILTQLYKYAFKNVQTVFFQNDENRQFFIDNNIATDKHKMLPGSGVNLEHFNVQDFPNTSDSLDFAFISRVMEDKGINEFLDAAETLKKKYEFVNFHIYGYLEDGYQNILQEYIAKDIVKYHGLAPDVREVFKHVHCVILPSYHEGLSNVLLEAAASGRPILASNIPGCRETFDEGVSGFGFKPKNSYSLVKTIEQFIQLSRDQMKAMGMAGRKKVEREFNRQIVIEKYMEQLDSTGIK